METEWCEVRQQDEPPDYYLAVDGTEYAVEVSTLMETLSVGALSLPHAAIVKSLWTFVDEVQAHAERAALLRGTYVVGFLEPIDGFAAVKDEIRSALLAYLKDTQALRTAPERTVFDRGAQRCSIQKIHNLANKIEKAGPMTVKWEGGAAPEICTILEERLADKKHKLRAIAKPKILLLLDWYHFAHAKMFLECVPRLPCLSCFHTVFVIRSESGNFVLHSENSGWRQGEPALLVSP